MSTCKAKQKKEQPKPAFLIIIFELATISIPFYKKVSN